MYTCKLIRMIKSVNYVPAAQWNLCDFSLVNKTGKRPDAWVTCAYDRLVVFCCCSPVTQGSWFCWFWNAFLLVRVVKSDYLSDIFSGRWNLGIFLWHLLSTRHVHSQNCFSLSVILCAIMCNLWRLLCLKSLRDQRFWKYSYQPFKLTKIILFICYVFCEHFPKLLTWIGMIILFFVCCAAAAHFPG